MVQKHPLSCTIVYTLTQFFEEFFSRTLTKTLSKRKSPRCRHSDAIRYKLYVSQEKSGRILPKLCNIQKLGTAQMPTDREEVKSRISAKYPLQLLQQMTSPTQGDSRSTPAQREAHFRDTNACVGIIHATFFFSVRKDKKLLIVLSLQRDCRRALTPFNTA